jgi:zinc protease
MLKKYFTAFGFYFLVLSVCVSADDAVEKLVEEVIEKPATEAVKLPNLFASEKSIPNIAVTEYTLSNGMKVALKSTNFEDDEILIRLSSKGGYALFDENNRASAELSPQVFLESGFDGLTPDKLSVLLYETSTEFSVNLNAFSRSIESTCSMDSIETALKLMNLSLTKHEFTEKAFQSVVDRTKLSIKKRNVDFETTFQEAYMATNTGNLASLRPLSIADVNKADFTTTKKFFDFAFSNPEDFVAVIVGDFKEEEIIPLIEKYLATIPKTSQSLNSDVPLKLAFPVGVTSKEIRNNRSGESLVRLTFPIQVEINEKNVFAVELACQLIEEKLRERIKNYFNTTQGVDVAYEFPIYPSLDLSWISIQFRAEPQSIEIIKKLIVTELKLLQSLGPSNFDLENAKIQQKQSDEYWLRQNDFWLASLSNYYLVGWDLKNVVQDAKKEKKLSTEKIRDVIRNYISLSNYTFIWSVN